MAIKYNGKIVQNADTLLAAFNIVPQDSEGLEWTHDEVNAEAIRNDISEGMVILSAMGAMDMRTEEYVAFTYMDELANALKGLYPRAPEILQEYGYDDGDGYRFEGHPNLLLEVLGLEEIDE